jgi:hypothetical protein
MASERLVDTIYQCKDIWGDRSYIAAGIIVGLPYESTDTIYKAAEFFRRADCPVDLANMFPLSIIGNHDLVKYMYMSEIDRNYSKYGYYFPNPEENYFKWHKDDGTDINSFDQAQNIVDEINPTLVPRECRGDFYLSSFNDDRLRDRELLLDLSAAEIKKLRESIDFPQLFRDTVFADYFQPLLKKLSSK